MKDLIKKDTGKLIEVGLPSYSRATHRVIFSFLKDVFVMSVKSLESVIKIILTINTFIILSS